MNTSGFGGAWSAGVESSASSSVSLAQNVRPLTEFGTEPIWLLLIKTVVLFAFLVVMTLFAILFERKVVAYMQVRPGPNRTGPWGALQSLADGLKLAFKEDILPKLADKVVFFMAPVISATTAFAAFAVVPFGPEVSIFGHRTSLQLTDTPVAVLYMLACSSLGVYGIVLGGWASGSSYPLLGALRSAAQMISYEVVMGLSIVAVFLLSGSFATSEVVVDQSNYWNIVLIAPSFLLYAVSAVGETNRAPFDLPEAEGELVGGFHTEYSSLKFALFFLAEYINMVTVSALCATLFLGGWRAPFGVQHVWAGANSGWVPLLWFFGKILLCLFVFVWLRGTLPRLRYDQFMQFAWKALVPFSLVWVLVVACLNVLHDHYHFSTVWVYSSVGMVVALLLVAVLFTPRRVRRPAGQLPASTPQPGAGYPLPPLDLMVPRQRRDPVDVGAAGAHAVVEGSSGDEAQDSSIPTPRKEDRA